MALTGDAGDELFGGYERYRPLALTELFQRIPSGPRQLLGGSLARILPSSAQSKTRLRRFQRLFEHINEPAEARYLGWMTTFDEAARMAIYSDTQLDLLATTVADLPESSQADPTALLSSAFAAAGRRDHVTRAMVGDILTYLPGDLLVKVDIASMAHSLECRGPFLDHRVVELAVAMPVKRKIQLHSGRSKIVLKRAFADLLPAPIRCARRWVLASRSADGFAKSSRTNCGQCCLTRSAWVEEYSGPRRSKGSLQNTSKGNASTRIDFGLCSFSSCGSEGMWIGLGQVRDDTGGKLATPPDETARATSDCDLKRYRRERLSTCPQSE